MLDARGRLRRLLLVWQTSVPTILLMPRGMHGVLPCSSSMVVVAGVHNTVGQMSAPTTLFNVRCTWEVASSSSGMADVGAYHTVDA